MFALAGHHHHGQSMLPLLAAAARAAWGATSSASSANSTGLQWGFATAAAPTNKMALIRELREKSGAPINDVKASLEAVDWQLDQAYDALRKKGLAAAAKKASRYAAEGLVAIAQDGPGRAAIVEVNSETDFVARNDRFKALVSQAAHAALGLTQDAVGAGHEVDVEQLGALQLQPGGGASVSEACAEVAAVVRENIRLRRGFLLTSPGVISAYMHMPVAPGLGRIAALVALEGPTGTNTEQLSELDRSLAMHVAGLRPQYLDGSSIPQHVLASERALLHEQATSSGKAAQVVEKMVEGRLAKYRQEVCLLDQKYLLDDNLTVRQLLAKAGSKGAPVRLSAFLRVQCGEGLQEQQEMADFAAEVAEMAAFCR